jgi:hypothetical protein
MDFCRDLIISKYRGHQKVTQPIPGMFCQKINHNEIKKQKTMLYQASEMSTTFSNA